MNIWKEIENATGGQAKHNEKTALRWMCFFGLLSVAAYGAGVGFVIWVILKTMAHFGII